MAPTLSPQQAAIGRLLLQKAIAEGAPRDRAPELVDAAYSESSLDPNAVNKTSGAKGLFQLLSPGYVSTAERLGGVANPAANLGAILPEYERFWAQNPGAAPGAAASAVERSGEGAGFYSNGAGRELAAKLGGVQASPAASRFDPLAAAHPAANTAAPAQTPPGISPVLRFLLDMPGASLASAVNGAPSPPAAAPAPAPSATPRYTPQSVAATLAKPAAPAGTLHLAAVPNLFDTRPGIQVDQQILPEVEQLAKQFGVQVNSGYRSAAHNTAVGGAENSDHLTGDAVDFTGTPQALQALYKYAQGRYPYVEPWSQTGGSHDHISFKR